MTRTNDRTIDCDRVGINEVAVETTGSPTQPTIIVIRDPENGDRVEFTLAQIDSLRDSLDWAVNVAREV